MFTSLTADIKCASMASFPGHLITSLSGNLYRYWDKNSYQTINLLEGLYRNVSTECFVTFIMSHILPVSVSKRVKRNKTKQGNKTRI